MCSNILDHGRALEDPRVRYVLAVLLGDGDALPSGLSDWFTYGQGEQRSGTRGICVVPSGFFAEDSGSARSLPSLPLGELECVPVLFGEPSIERHGDLLVVHADIVASAYFLLTRYEEWIQRDVRDMHGRFPGTESLPYRAGFIDRPIVEEYSSLLRKWAGELGIRLPAPMRRFSVLLTHDVDYIGMPRTPLQAARSLASGLLGRQPWKSAARRAGAALGLARDPLDNLDKVIRFDRRLADGRTRAEVRSMYFFMAGGDSRFDCNYDLRDPRAQRALQRVLASDAELGLHASYAAGQRPELLAAERSALEEVAGIPICKNRFHYLGWREPQQGHALASAGITWDSTLGYADVAGFRLGVCHPVPLFDPIRKCPFGIKEHPLVVMECSLSGASYMDLNEDAAFDYVCKLADATFRHQGEFVALWHNQVLASIDNSYHRRLYPRVLDYLHELLGADQRA